MPEWTPLEIGFDPFPSRGPRSSGVHLSDIRAYLKKRLNIGKQYSEDRDPLWSLAPAIGFAFEDAMIGALAEYAVLPVPLIRGMEAEIDGIFMSPDGIDPQSFEVWEFKWTWRSCVSSPPETIWDWLVQIMAYARWAGPMQDGSGRYSAVLCAFYPCGDYRPPSPKMLVGRLIFTEEEVERNWEMFREGLRMMQKEGLV